MPLRHRPPIWLRASVAVLGLGLVAFNAMLMLSDRAPGASRRFGGDVLRRLSERIDAGGRPAAIADRTSVPDGEVLVHLGVWAAATVLVGLAVWTWRGLAVAVGGLVVVSTLIEFGQGRYTDTRVTEMSDVAANIAGIALGAVFVALCYLVWETIGRAVGAGRSADTSHRDRVRHTVGHDV